MGGPRRKDCGRECRFSSGVPTATSDVGWGGHGDKRCGVVNEDLTTINENLLESAKILESRTTNIGNQF